MIKSRRVKKRIVVQDTTWGLLKVDVIDTIESAAAVANNATIKNDGGLVFNHSFFLFERRIFGSLQFMLIDDKNNQSACSSLQTWAAEEF